MIIFVTDWVFLLTAVTPCTPLLLLFSLALNQKTLPVNQAWNLHVTRLPFLCPCQSLISAQIRLAPLGVISIQPFLGFFLLDVVWNLGDGITPHPSSHNLYFTFIVSVCANLNSTYLNLCLLSASWVKVMNVIWWLSLLWNEGSGPLHLSSTSSLPLSEFPALLRLILYIYIPKVGNMACFWQWQHLQYCVCGCTTQCKAKHGVLGFLSPHGSLPVFLCFLKEGVSSIKPEWILPSSTPYLAFLTILSCL